MIKIKLETTFPDLIKEIDRLGKSTRGAAREAMNQSAEHAKKAMEKEIESKFDRPVPFTRRALRVYYASTSRLEVKLWFRQRRQDEDKLWAVPQIEGGQREWKPMEKRLNRAGYLPKGWYVMPGNGAPLDSYGNMSAGEISRILNVLGTYTESGYNKANNATTNRLRRGTRKSYGFEYFVVRPGAKSHLLPGVYRRVYTSFGQAVVPMMIFVQNTNYKARLPFERRVREVFDQQFPKEYDKALKSLFETGSASGLRRGIRLS